MQLYVKFTFPGYTEGIFLAIRATQCSHDSVYRCTTEGKFDSKLCGTLTLKPGQSDSDSVPNATVFRKSIIFFRFPGAFLSLVKPICTWRWAQSIGETILTEEKRSTWTETGKNACLFHFVHCGSSLLLFLCGPLVVCFFISYNVHRANIHALGWIRTPNLSKRVATACGLDSEATGIGSHVLLA